MKTIRILILEDDLETLATILRALSVLEKKSEVVNNKDFAVTIFSEYTQVEDYLNVMTELSFNIVLLDRDCKLGGSFHSLDLKRFGVDKVIGISSVPKYNDDLKGTGVTKIVAKDYNDLATFALKVVSIVEEMIERRTHED